MVEQIFRSAKSLLETRPIYHKRDETRGGHVFCTFLALILRKALQDRLDEAGVDAEWAEVIRDHDALSFEQSWHKESRNRITNRSSQRRKAPRLKSNIGLQEGGTGST